MGGGYFDPAACARIAQAFEALDEATVEARLASPQAAAAGLYCWPVGPDEVAPSVHELAGFFERAAAANSGVMVMMY
jgi:phage tail sheath protein FI